MYTHAVYAGASAKVGGDLGALEPGEMMEEFEAVVLALPAGDKRPATPP